MLAQILQPSHFSPFSYVPASCERSLNVGGRNLLTSFRYIAQVESKKDAMSVALKRFCLDPRNPVTVIRGLCEALKIGMYATFHLLGYGNVCRHSVVVQHRSILGFLQIGSLQIFDIYFQRMDLKRPETFFGILLSAICIDTR